LTQRALLWLAAVCAISSFLPANAQPPLVERGENLARLGDCVACHTADGGELNAGGGRINTPFGYMLAPNITPDPETGIGKWTEAEFYRAMHEGINRRGEEMFPTMPYDFYTKVTREDVSAIFAYLRTVRPVHNQVQVNHLHFPFNLRVTMLAWRELYFTPGTFVPDPVRSAAWNRGAYLVEGLGHCADCHSPRDALGGIDKDKDFTGSFVDGWFALDLTSELTTGLGAWSVDQIATYLKTGAFEGKTTAVGPMATVIEDSLKYASAADAQAIAAYLKAIPADSVLRTGRIVPDALRIAGANLYMEHCADCHQSLGRGIPGAFPSLVANGVVLARAPDTLLKVILVGTPGQHDRPPMPPYAQRLTDEQIAAVANYVRTSWGNGAPPNATAATVHSLR
jgi:mono/diheme cytochrome c family protein